MRLVAERNDWYGKYASVVGGVASANPDLLPVDHRHPELQAHGDDLSAASGAGELKGASQQAPDQRRPFKSMLVLFVWTNDTMKHFFYQAA